MIRSAATDRPLPAHNWRLEFDRLALLGNEGWRDKSDSLCAGGRLGGGGLFICYSERQRLPRPNRGNLRS
jgi:hypothetical protein